MLTTTHDFFSTEDALRLLARRTGAKVRRVDLYDDPAAATVDEMTQRLVDARHPAHPRGRGDLGALQHRRPDAGPGDRRRDRRPATDVTVLCVDGVHGFAAVDVDLPDLGCDFLATGTHKWLFGPRGTGILWGQRLGTADRADPDVLRPRTGRAGSPPAATTTSSTGGRSRTRSSSSERSAATGSWTAPSSRRPQLKDGLAGIDGITVVTPADPGSRPASSASTSRGTPPANAVLALREPGIVASATPYAPSYLRLGPSIVTSPEQVDQAIAALQEIV